jgi:D-alanyl-D-alanine carboxypeptidase
MVWALIVVLVLGVVGVRMMIGFATEVAATGTAAAGAPGRVGADGAGAGGVGGAEGDAGVGAAGAADGHAPGRAAEGTAAMSGGAQFNSTADVSDITDTGQLVLVNGAHGLSRAATPAGLVDVWPTLPVGEDGLMMDRTALEAAQAMVEAAGDAGVTGLYLTDAFRTRAVQQQLYDEADDKSYVQTPGHSEHETGLAIDIGVADMAADETFTDTRAADWLGANSWRYGFILRYPDGGQDSTGIAYESWHFRYVGQPHARYMADNNFTFEQYIAALRSAGGYSITLDGVEYTVTYELARDGKIGIPDGGNYDISRDNTGGYIVTQWR